MYEDRIKLYRKLERDRQSSVIAYITGDRRGLETQISPEVVDLFVQHLDSIGPVPKLTIFLYTKGGNTLAAWNLINLLRIFSDKLEIIVPRVALSAGTLMCLGADAIIMTKQATLGPIDPSVTTMLNPPIPNAAPNARIPVNVESVNGFIEFAKQALGKGADLTQALSQLSASVHPLVLGDAYRARAQIRMLASRLLDRDGKRKAKTRQILEFLCSESGSHDYTINRREAKKQLGLPIVIPNDAQYHLIKAIYDDIARELELQSPYDPAGLLGQQPSVPYTLTRALIESRKGGSDAFQSQGILSRQQFQLPPNVPVPAMQPSVVSDDRQFDGWRHRAKPPRNAGSPAGTP